MIGIDTNVLVRYVTRDEPRQFKVAEELFDDLAQAGDAFVNVIVLCELVWVLEAAYALEKATIVDVLRRLLDTVEIAIEDRELVAEAVEDFAAGKAGFADYLIGTRNRAAGCDVTMTFDRALRASRGFRVL